MCAFMHTCIHSCMCLLRQYLLCSPTGWWHVDSFKHLRAEIQSSSVSCKASGNLKNVLSQKDLHFDLAVLSSFLQQSWYSTAALPQSRHIVARFSRRFRVSLTDDDTWASLQYIYVNFNLFPFDLTTYFVLIQCLAVEEENKSWT